MKTSIIIISYNTKNLTIECINSIYKYYNNQDIEIIVVDNASNDGTVEYIKNKFPEVKIIENQQNLGYAKAVNIGVYNSSTNNCLVINSDIVFLDNYNEVFKLFEKNKNIGIIGIQQIFPNYKWQRSFGNYPCISNTLKDIFFINKVKYLIEKILFLLNVNFLKEVEYVDGAFLFINKEIFKKISGFDEDYFFYTEEVDFCYRLKKNNYKIIFYPQKRIIHYRGASQKNKKIKKSSLDLMIKNNIKFIKKNFNYDINKIKLYLKLEYFQNLKNYFVFYFNPHKREIFKTKIEVIKTLLQKGKL